MRASHSQPDGCEVAPERRVSVLLDLAPARTLEWQTSDLLTCNTCPGAGSACVLRISVEQMGTD
jgi:hypothetical protein